MLGYLTCLYLITRTILKPTGDSYKPLEYMGTIAIYLVALYSYADILDAMIFIGLLLILVILGYVKKVGPLFVISLIGIIINFFKLR